MSFGRTKQDTSIKLKSQNMKDTRRQTEQMADETRRMEVRLQELKLAMAAEREQRERQGSGFWRSAQTNQPTGRDNKKGKGKRIKVAMLKDEPIVLPERSKQPGTFGGIARNKMSPRDKIKGPKCGQCEAKAAHVSCMECGEDYCATCFASFHLKGALKKHRSVPVGTQGGGRISLTPRRAQNGDVVLRVSPRKDNSQGQQVAVQSNPPLQGGSLLDGSYNEADAHADFQSALAEWRQNKNTASTENRQKKTVSFAPPRNQTEEFATDTGCDNVVPERKVEISFQRGGGLTYAEKLLLKQHRRGERRGGGGVPAHASHPIVQSARDSYSAGSAPHDAERVDFDALKQVALPPDDAARLKSASAVQITEIDTTKVRSAVLRGLPQTSMCRVEEREAPRPQTSPSPAVTPSPPPTPNAPKGPRRAFATPSPTMRRRIAANFSPEPPRSPELPSKTPIVDFNDPTPTTTPRKPKAQAQPPKPRGKQPESARTETRSGADVDELVKRVKEENAQKTPRPTSSAKSRPQSRPGSRAASRAGSARPKSRTWMYGEGSLTKVPSADLRAISQLAHETVGDILKKVGMESIAPTNTPLADFFRLGVASPPPPQERTLTPTADRARSRGAAAAADERHRLGNKVYQTGPRSWRPDSSLGNHVDDDAVAGFLDDAAVRDGVRGFYAAEDAEAAAPEGDGATTVAFSLQQQQQQLAPGQSGTEPMKTRSSPLPSDLRSSDVTSGERKSGTRSRSSASPGRRPRSNAVVVDGEDLSRYDELGRRQLDDRADSEALEQLEWELASQEGRLTADGKVSRLSLGDTDLSDEERELGIGRDDGRGTGLTTPDPELNHRLRESVLLDDFEEMEAAAIQDESDVKALQ